MSQLVLYLQHCLAIESGSNTSKDSTKAAVTLFNEGALMWPDCCAVGRFVEDELQRLQVRQGLYFD